MSVDYYFFHFKIGFEGVVGDWVRQKWRGRERERESKERRGREGEEWHDNEPYL